MRRAPIVGGSSTGTIVDPSSEKCSPDLFDKGGLGLRVGNPAVGYETYLLPDAAVKQVPGVTKSGQISSPQSNLIVIDAELPADERKRLAGELTGVPVTLMEMAMSE